MARVISRLILLAIFVFAGACDRRENDSEPLAQNGFAEEKLAPFAEQSLASPEIDASAPVGAVTSPDGKDRQSEIRLGDDLLSYLGQPIEQFMEHAPGQLVDEADESLTSDGAAAMAHDLNNWRRVSIFIVWQTTNSVVTRPLIVSFRKDTDQIWRLQIPVGQDEKGLRIGRIADRLRFTDCTAILGRPARVAQYAPVVGRAWWDDGSTTLRVDHYTETYRDIEGTIEAGRLQWIAAYRNDIAPAGFDDEYAALVAETE